MTPEERRDLWMVARARSNRARENAANLTASFPRQRPVTWLQAMRELDHYLARYGSGCAPLMTPLGRYGVPLARGWSGR